MLLVVSGRPLALEWAFEHCSAVVLAWVPGEAGPAAIADVLAGDADPGGRLPITMPRHVGQVPQTYRHHPTGGRSNWKGDYVDGAVAPLWPFGHGRSYTTFSIEALRVDRATLDTAGDEVVVRVDVTNTGPAAGEEVVQLYVRDEEATVARPVIELRGFRRVRLEPGECRTVAFRLSTEQLAYTGADYRRVVEPGLVRDLRGPLVGGPAPVRGADPHRADGRARRAHAVPHRGDGRDPHLIPAGVGGPPPRRRPSGRPVAV